jgi:hypothetical protein
MMIMKGEVTLPDERANVLPSLIHNFEHMHLQFLFK